MTKAWMKALMLSAAMIPGFTRAAVPIAENGQVKAVVVANGNRSQAATLTNCLAKIIGASLPVVRNATAVAAGPGSK